MGHADVGLWTLYVWAMAAFWASICFRDSCVEPEYELGEVVLVCTICSKLKWPWW